MYASKQLFLLVWPSIILTKLQKAKKKGLFLVTLPAPAVFPTEAGDTAEVSASSCPTKSEGQGRYVPLVN